MDWRYLPPALFFFSAPLLAQAAGAIPPVKNWLWDLESKGNPPSGSAELVDFDPQLGQSSGKGSKQGISRGSAKYVICYFSAGSYEAGRPDMAGLKQGKDFGQALKGGNEGGQWKSDGKAERWLNYKSEAVREVMKGRLNDAKERGCDGVEPDNVDSDLDPDNTSGFKNDPKEYLQWLAQEAHSRNLSIGLKNAGSIASQMSSVLDFAVVEQCYEEKSCSQYKSFTSAGKAVLIAAYTGSVNQAWCKDAQQNKFALTFFPKDQNVKNGKPCP